MQINVLILNIPSLEHYKTQKFIIFTNTQIYWSFNLFKKEKKKVNITHGTVHKFK